MVETALRHAPVAGMLNVVRQLAELDRYPELAELLSHMADMRRRGGRRRPGCLARTRIGGVVLIAIGTDFLAPQSYRFEHGSRTEAELRVPFARWSA